MRPHHTHWPARVPHAIRVAATSLWENLAHSARRFPEHIAIEFLGRSITYAELARQVDVMAAHLAQLGVSRGDRVLLDRKSTRLNSSHIPLSRMPSSA